MSRINRNGNASGLVAVGAGLTVLLALGFCGVGERVAFAQSDPYIYPSKGQSPEQQSKDKYECHTWAVQQTGYDPSAPPPPPSAPPPSTSTTQQTGPDGTVVRSAARGAAVGAVGGAIAGDAGKGAAAGAAMGGTMGVFRKVDKQRQQQQQAQQQAQQQSQQQAQQQAQSQQMRDQYNKALKACMGGRGYTVE